MRQSCRLFTEKFKWCLLEEAVQMDILDPREAQWWFNTGIGGSCVLPIRLLQARYQEVKNFPPTSDVQRFPNQEICQNNMAFNREYLKYLEAESLLRTWQFDWYQNAISETQQLYHIWEAMNYIQSDGYFVAGKRQALQDLKDKLGDAAYHAGWVPPCVPVWRFKVLP